MLNRGIALVKNLKKTSRIWKIPPVFEKTDFKASLLSKLIERHQFPSDKKFQIHSKKPNQPRKKIVFQDTFENKRFLRIFIKANSAAESFK